MTLDTSIQLGLSTAFHNKTNLTSSAGAFGDSFTPSTTPIAAFATPLFSGKAWTQGDFNGSVRHGRSFRSAQTLVLDSNQGINVEQALAEPLIARYALPLHPSPSSWPDLLKTRVIFAAAQWQRRDDQTEPAVSLVLWSASDASLKTLLCPRKIVKVQP